MHLNPACAREGGRWGPRPGGSLGLREAEPVRGRPHTGNLLSGHSHKDLICILMALSLLHKSPKVPFYLKKKEKKERKKVADCVCCFLGDGRGQGRAGQGRGKKRMRWRGLGDV